MRGRENDRGDTTASTPFFATPRGLILVGVALLALLCVAVTTGTTHLSLSDALHDPATRTILFELRLPRVLFALLVGGALATVGVAYQTLFRNYLASPFTLGVSSGAALGASLSLMLMTPQLGVVSSAMAGALVGILVILGVSRRIGKGAGDSLLIVGIVFSFFCSSVLTLLQYVSDYSQLFRVTRWMMGGIPAVTMLDLIPGVLLITLFLVWIVRRHREFDLMLFGDDFAATKGVDVRRLYHASFLLSSLVVGWIVAHCGVIGFVGIIVPAIARNLVGLRHRHLVPLSFLIGAILVVGCDLLGRISRPPFEVPAGVFTAVLGGPIFIARALSTSRRR